VATSQSTYAYRNGVVILEVKLDMMVVQCGDSLAPDNQETERYKVSDSVNCPKMKVEPTIDYWSNRSL
jgi:hypothetical protein